MTRYQILALSNILNKIDSTLKPTEVSTKFLYKLAKIKNIIDKEAQIYTKMQQDIFAIIKPYEMERMEILSKYAQKDENGNPIVENGIVKLEPSKIKEAQEELKKLDEKYKHLLEQFEEKSKEFESFMNEEIEIKFEPISVNELPDKLPLTLNEMQLFALICKD